MALIIGQLKIFIAEAEQVFSLRIDLHLRHWKWLAPQLCMHLLQVIHVDVHITEGVNEIAGLEAHDLRNHHREQCVRRDVERYAEKYIRASLIHLAAEFPV